MFDFDKDINLVITVSEKIGIEVANLCDMLHSFDEYPRVYHSSDHIKDLWAKILADKYQPQTERCLLLTALYHDYVYDPRSKTNEEDSAKKFDEDVNNSLVNLPREVVHLIYDTIIDTKTHVPRTAFSKLFCQYDLSGFKTNVIENELRIRKEYAWADWEDYKKGKLEFLAKYRKIELAKEDPALQQGMDLIAEFTRSGSAPKIGVYAGSFNPFHVGHKNILEQAEKVFDKVILAQGINPEKGSYVKQEDINYMLQKEINEDGHWIDFFRYRQYDIYSTSLTEYLNSKPYLVTLIRGLRNTTDLQYEMNQTQWLKQVNKDLQVAYFVCDKEFEHVSSSGIKLAQKFSDLEGVAESYIVE